LQWLAGQVTLTVERNELLLKLFFGKESSIPISAKHVDEYRSMQTARHDECKAIEARIKSKSTQSPDAPYWLMTVGHGIKVAKARLDWCDETLARLKRMAKANRQQEP
jgi:PadR family transcriptional regulator AphA